jgi:CoA-transferase family III
MALDKYPMTKHFFDVTWSALGGDPKWVEQIEMEGEGILESSFYTSDFGSGVYAALAAAVSEVVALSGAPAPFVRMDRLVSSAQSMCDAQPVGGWRLPTAVGGEALWDWYPTSDDRWLEVHVPYPYQAKKMLMALGADWSKEGVAEIVRQAPADELEEAILRAGGTAAASRTMEEWAVHEHGKRVLAEPFMDVVETTTWKDDGWRPTPGRPLAGLHVLDCTRVVAGPEASRFLAGLGAEVLRIDPPVWEETGGAYEAGDLLAGKRCTRLDLQTTEGHDTFLRLLSEADVFIHGYRQDVLDGLGLGEEVRDVTRPGLVEACEDAYGWTGPWQGRRGFDCLVLTSSGLSVAEGEWAGLDHPRGMGTVILDHTVGYAMATAILRGLTRRLTTGMGSRSRAALARSAAELARAGRNFEPEEPYLPGRGARGYKHGFATESRVCSTPNGPARRTLPPFEIDNTPLFWDRSGELLGSAAPRWASVHGGTRGFEWWSELG